MMRFFKGRDRRGQNLVDYTLMLALGGMLAVASLSSLGNQTERLFNENNAAIQDAVAGIINNGSAASMGGGADVFQGVR